MKRFIAILLTIVVFVSSFSFSSYAAGENEDTNVIEIDLSKAVVNLYAVPTNGAPQTIYTPYMERKNAVIGGVAMTGFRSTNADYYKNGRSKNLVVMDMPKIKVDTTYSTSISHAISFNGRYGFKVEVEIWSKGGTKREEIFYEEYSGSSVHTSEFSFSIPSSLVGSSAYSCTLFISNEIISETTTGQDGTVVWQYMQSLIRMTDDNAGWFVKILNAIKAIPDKLRGYFAALGDAISGLGDKIGGFFTDLKNNISGWFSEQLAKIQELSDNLKQWFIDLGNNIKQWFLDLGDKIGDFFTMLKNYLLYFQHPVTLDKDGVPIGADGKPVYTNPFASALDTVRETINGWIENIKQFISSIDDSRVSVSEYISNGSTLVSGILKAAPALSAVIGFALVFLVIRKVVGR